MPKQKKQIVWLVTSGCYSDYKVRAVCSTEKKAEVVSACCRDPNPPIPMEIDRLVEMCKSGKKLYLCWCSRETADIEPLQFDPDWEPDELDCGDSLRLWVWAEDAEHAAKIANERRSMWLAGNYPAKEARDA